MLPFSLLLPAVEGLSDAAAVPIDAVQEEAKGPNPFAIWIEFIRSSVLSINEFYKGKRRQMLLHFFRVTVVVVVV